jgi:hypothetical protein
MEQSNQKNRSALRVAEEILARFRVRESESAPRPSEPPYLSLAKGEKPPDLWTQNSLKFCAILVH